MLRHLTTRSLTLALLVIISPLAHAAVYDTLEFGDTREEVTKKLKASKMVKQQMEGAFFGRTGLNGVFKCNAKLANLSYRLYFDWTESGGLKEVTLRSDAIKGKKYDESLKTSWAEATKLFTQVYGKPAQGGTYPKRSDFKGHDILMTHIWHKGSDQSILIGPGIDKDKCFLAIRFINKRIEPVRIK